MKELLSKKNKLFSTICGETVNNRQILLSVGYLVSVLAGMWVVSKLLL